MNRPEVPPTGRLSGTTRLPWFVLAWLAPAAYVALHSLATLGGATGSPSAALSSLAALARLAEWPVAGCYSVAAVVALLRHRRQDRGSRTGALTDYPAGTAPAAADARTESRDPDGPVG